MSQVIKTDKNAVIKALVEFHEKFNSTSDRERKIEMLREMATRLFGNCRDQKLWFRRQFNSKKKKFNWGQCRVCGVKAQLVHHVIQVQNGGHNHRRNLVPLCHSCHAEIHPWLKIRCVSEG